MCGIFFIKNNNLKKKNFFFKKKINNAVNYQSFRGPDKKSIYFDKNFLMGFNYLKITSGNDAMQPYKFDNLLIIFNGEIYNFKKIKKIIIKKHKIRFKTNSDTEVVAAAIRLLGLKSSLKLFRGMFSIIGYDFKKRLFFIARDRLGIKPLFYFKNKSNIIMASTIESIRIALGKRLRIKKKTMNDYIEKGYLDLNNKTFFENIYSFPVASYVTFKDTFNEKDIIKIWELKTFNNSKTTNINDIRKVMKETFDIHRFKNKSAIPFSGGMDSNIIDYNYKNLFRASLIGENQLEEKTLKKLSRKKKIFLISNKKINFKNSLKEVAQNLDQPIRSSHWVYQFYLRKLFKKKNIRVMYSGDGADEVFAGYNYAFRYLLNENKKNLTKKIKENKLIINWLKVNKNINNFNKKISLKDFLKLRITKTHIPYWLRAEDEISMNNSIETRVPFLDHITIDRTFMKNSDIFFHKNKNKNILRKIYSKYVDKSVLKQKKIGKPGFSEDTYLLFKKNRNKIFKLNYINNNYYIKNIFNKIKDHRKINNDLLFRLLFLYFWFNKKKHLYSTR